MAMGPRCHAAAARCMLPQASPISMAAPQPTCAALRQCERNGAQGEAGGCREAGSLRAQGRPAHWRQGGGLCRSRERRRLQDCSSFELAGC